MQKNSIENKVFIKFYEYNKLTQKEKKTLTNKVQNLYANNKICKIKNGLYTMINPLNNSIYVNKYEIGTAMFKNAYIGYHTALEYYGLNNQILNIVQVMNEKKERDISFENYTYKFYIGDGKYVDERENNEQIKVTSLEKTLYDCVDKIKFAGGIEELYKAIETIRYIDEKKLLEILKYYNNKNVYQKIGWLFEVGNKKVLSDNFYNICKKHVTKTISLLENKKLKSKYYGNWKIIAPHYLVNNEVLYEV